MTPSPPDTPPHGFLIANLLAQIAFGLLAMTVCLPSMQEWGAIFGAEQAGVQLTLSGYLVAYGALQLLYGPLSDRHGRKRILMIGLAVAGIGSLLAALAPDLPSLIAARVLQGAGSAAGMVVGRAMVQDLFRGPERTRVMAWVGMTMGFCPPLATVMAANCMSRSAGNRTSCWSPCWPRCCWSRHGVGCRRASPRRPSTRTGFTTWAWLMRGWRGSRPSCSMSASWR